MGKPLTPFAAHCKRKDTFVSASLLAIPKGYTTRKVLWVAA